MNGARAPRQTHASNMTRHRTHDRHRTQQRGVYASWGATDRYYSDRMGDSRVECPVSGFAHRRIRRTHNCAIFEKGYTRFKPGKLGNFR